MVTSPLKFDNRFSDRLPADPAEGSSLRQVHGAAFSRVRPTPVSDPSVVATSPEMMALVGLSPDDEFEPWFAEAFSGNALVAGMDPFAMAYGGHQFGNWAGQLGDGRAIALGEVLATDGTHQMLQLKGAGPTPYSRRADGRAVLRSSVREFLCSEAMHHLGIPTTRALCLIRTGDEVVRDMFYDGHPKPETGAIVTRVAPTFTRFGSLQLPASRGDLDLLRSIADYTLVTDFPEISADGPAGYGEMFAEICSRTAVVVSEWMRVGFVHGVMNTDNMGISGLTIDYGPYGWIDDYDLDWTPNTTDAGQRRYRFGAQPQVAQWNLAQLAAALEPLIGDVELLQAAMNLYVEVFQTRWADTFGAKLGIGRVDPEADRELFSETHRVLQLAETDMTLFFRALGSVDIERPITVLPAELGQCWYRPEQLTDEVSAQLVGWLESWRQRANDGPSAATIAARQAAMNLVNPKYVLRNYMAQLAIDAAEERDYSVIAELGGLLRRPYEEQPELSKWADKRPDWARTRAGCSMLSCSS